MKKIIRYFSITFVTVLLFATSCVKDIPESTLDPSRYTAADITSYSDLFNLIWCTMSQKYNYFNEQEDGYWENIHQTYSPKFDSLRTFVLDSAYSNDQIEKDYKKAVEYFTDIFDPIIDRHFVIRIKFPTSQHTTISETFHGGMKNTTPTYYYSHYSRSNYMSTRLIEQTKVSKEGAFFGQPDGLFGGYLIDHPDIYYLCPESFCLTTSYILSFPNTYLVIDTNSTYYLTETMIRNSVQSLVSDENARAFLIDESIKCVNRFNTFMKSEAVMKVFNDISEFNKTEVVNDSFERDIEFLCKNALNIPDEMVDIEMSDEGFDNPDYVYWFKKQLDNYLTYSVNYNKFISDMNNVLSSKYKLDLYKNFFNPLKEGKVAKLILDLRGNGGGNVMDARTFIDRFITKSEIFAYQRFKEDNNPFSYSPWVPCHTYPSQYSMKNEIPIVILLDKKSLSMSEISTLMLKSQGSQVCVVGNYSGGGTACLTDKDYFNGGSKDVLAGGLVTFYMPAIATMDATRTVIEGVGIKPNYELEPLTEEEFTQMIYDPKTHIDRGLKKAIEVLL